MAVSSEGRTDRRREKQCRRGLPIPDSNGSCLSHLRLFCLGLLAFVPAGVAHADEAEARAEQAIKNAGGSIYRIAPDKPVNLIKFIGTKATDDVLPSVIVFKEVETLQLWNTRITSLKGLAELKNLRLLDMSNSPVTDEGLKEIATPSSTDGGVDMLVVDTDQ